MRHSSSSRCSPQPSSRVSCRSRPRPKRLPTGSFDARERSITDIRSALRAGHVTCRDIVTQYLARIDSYNRKGPNINAVQSVNPAALAEADRLDSAMRTAGTVWPLHCATVLVKDQIETRDMPTTYGSVAFKDFTPTRDATVVK